MKKICRAKHTKNQPKKWVCPDCGADHEYFYISEGPNVDCELLHDDDYIVCDNCAGEWDGDVLSKIMDSEKKKCPCCDGKGWILEDKKGQNDE